MHRLGMKKPPQTTSGWTKTIRLPETMGERLEQEQARQMSERPYAVITISDVIRATISSGLEALQRDED